MKIGIEVQRLFRKKKHGMEIVALELLKQFQEIKFEPEFEFILFVRNDKDSVCIETKDNFRIVKLSANNYIDWEQVRLPLAVKKEKIDLLHCTCNTAPLRLNIPYIVTLHDIIYLENISFKGTFYQNFGNLYRRWIVPNIIKRSKGIITVSEFERNNIIESLGIESNKIKVIYNGVHKKFKIIEDEKKLLYYKNKNKLPDRFILFLGNTAPKKNTTRVLKAYQLYFEESSNPIPLVIIDFNKKYLPDFIRNNTNIIPLNFIPNDDLPILYNLASLFLYPSLRESFGMPILEAMACGTPVITSNTSSMPEIAGSAAILVNPYDPHEISKKIEFILNNQNIYDDKVKEGIINIKKFSWENSANKLVDYYRSIIMD